MNQFIGTVLCVCFLTSILTLSAWAEVEAPFGAKPYAPYPETLPHPSKDEKLLGLALWVIETMPVNREIISVTMEEHIRYQLELERTGIMFAAGPVFGPDATKPDGNGLVIIRADNVDQARAIADADPMHRSGGRSYRLRQWRVNEGSFTVTVPFSRYHTPTIK